MSNPMVSGAWQQDRKVYYKTGVFIIQREVIKITKDILVEPYIDSIMMPENLKIGLEVSEQREKCKKTNCSDEFYSLAFGQSPFHVPEPMVRALAAHSGKGHYSDAEGIPRLRETIAGFNKRHFKLDVDPSRIVVGPGTKELIHFVFNIVKGGTIIPSPSWIGYFPMIKLLDKHFHTFPLKPEFDYKIRPDDLDEHLSKLPGSQHLLVINNPHNPTGTLYARQELEKIADVCRERNAFVLSDEIYALTTYEFDDFSSMGLVYPEGTFVTNGLSKDRSAGGFRLGSCILPEDCTEKLKQDFRKVAATVYTNVSTPTQYAAISADEPNDEIEEYFRITRKIHRMMGRYMSDGFNSVEGVKATTPKGGFYFFADFNELSDDLRRKRVNTSNALGRSLLSHPHHIAVVTGDAVMLREDDFGARIAFVDYDGRKAFEGFKQSPPGTRSDETAFVEQYAPVMVRGIRTLGGYVKQIRQG